MKAVKVYSPATIANVACGFDVLGLALKEPVDEMIFRKSDSPGVHICNIIGANLSKESNKNVVGVVLESLLDHLPNNKYGIEVDIFKNIKPGSGIGSSAASAAGAAVGANFLFGNPFKTIDLINFSALGEELACGTPHADNISPAILGGFTLVKGNSKIETSKGEFQIDNMDIVSLPYPRRLWATVIHPQIEIKTSEARKMLKKNVFMEDAILHWGNVGALVSALYTEDYSLLGKCLKDFIVEPIRYVYIPEFNSLKIKCKKAGALGGSISGSGPSVFMFSEGKETAIKVAECMNEIYNKLNIPYKIYISPVNNVGVKAEFIY
jgi:homoserine kinase